MKTIFALLFLLLSISAFAQQDPLYAQYMLNPLLLNPAYTGLSNNLNIMVGYRTQWTGLEGQPQTFNLTAHTSLVDNKVGLGFLFTNDKIGNVSKTESDVTFSYKIELSDGTFSFGMQTGLQNYTTDFSELNVRDPDDNAFMGSENETRMNIGAGVIFKNERLLLGVSMPRMLPSSFISGGEEFHLYNQHYYIMGSYVIFLNDHLRFEPSALLRGVKGVSPTVDLSFKLNLNAEHTAGLFTRNFNTYGILLQTLLNEKLQIGYAFEVPANNSVGTIFPTHEISLGLQLYIFSFHSNSISNF